MSDRRPRGARKSAVTPADVPSTDQPARRAQRRLERAAEGLVGVMDHPESGMQFVGEVNVSGWVAHRQREVTGVVVTVNGKVAGAAAVDTARPDVAAHLRIADDTPVGWYSTVALDREDDEYLVEAFAVLAQERTTTEEAPGRLGLPVPFASALVRAADLTDFGGGPNGLERPSAALLPDQRLTLGYNRLYGTADVPGEISRVEVTCDGVGTGPARTALPGHAHRAGTEPSARIALFEAGVTITRTGEIEVAGTVETVDGRQVPIDPVTIEVAEPAMPKAPSADRIESVRRRTAAVAARRTPRSPLASSTTPPVLVVTHDLGLGGGQLWLHELVLRLHARGVPMAVTSLRGGVLAERLEDLGIPVLVTGGLDARDAEAYEAQVLLVTEWAVDHGCTRAIANTMSAFPGVDAAERLGLPVSWAIHESFPLTQFWTEAFGPPTPPYAAERGEHALGLTDLAVFEAQATLDLYAPYLPEGSGHVVPYGVDFSDIDAYVAEHDRAEVRARLGFDESTLVLLCLGTIEPRKAQINLAQAFLGSAEIAERDVVLVCVGAQAGSAYVATLEDYVERMDGQARVRIEPVQPDTYQWYHAADALLCASDVESLPRSMLEVMAFGKPVASTAVFGIPDLITEGETGYLCEPRDLAALRRLLERTAATPRADLVAMGARARALVVARHDPEIYTDFFLDWLTADRTGGDS